MASSGVVDYGSAMTRNAGLVGASEQDTLRESLVVIIGVGGDGGLVAERLARLGVGRLRLIDPGQFDVENLNRQYASSSETLGQNKAVAVGARLREIAPWADIEIVEQGIDATNAQALLEGCSLVIDESEFSEPVISAAVCKAARLAGIPVLTGANVGFGANIFAFHPTGMTLERYMGVSDGADADADVIAAAQAWCPVVPSYIDYQVFETAASGAAPVPSVSQAVAAVAAVVSHEAFEYLAGRRELVWVPRYISIDLHRRSMRIRRATQLGFLLSVLRLRLFHTRSQR